MLSFRAADVFAAAQRIRPAVRRTPLRRSDALSRQAGGDVHLKLECEQVTGSFKIRGAYNVIASLPEAVRRRGVVAASAGNHGMGVAHAAQQFGTPATIYVPASAPAIKRDGIAGFGATVDDGAENFDDARRRAEAAARESGATFIHPCEGEVLIAGQGTVGLELLEDLPGMRTLIVPVGGAGLAGGIASILRAVAPHIRIVGVQTENTDAMARAFSSGVPEKTANLPTLAEGLAGDADAYALELLRFAVDEMVVVSEESVERAIAWLHEHEELVAEGSGAVGVAAILEGRISGAADPIGVIVTGRNIDATRHAEIIERYRRS
jgi:threonine dehydratase